MPTPNLTSAPTERPEWLDTPSDYLYILMMSDGDAQTPQEINDITREEFIALKVHLAKMRGYDVPETQERN
jgi:hypothetical protein